jgi:hypothetical protein
MLRALPVLEPGRALLDVVREGQMSAASRAVQRLTKRGAGGRLLFRHEIEHPDGGTGGEAGVFEAVEPECLAVPAHVDLEIDAGAVVKRDDRHRRRATRAVHTRVIGGRAELGNRVIGLINLAINYPIARLSNYPIRAVRGPCSLSARMNRRFLTDQRVSSERQPCPRPETPGC